ncbi:MAG: acyltransferase [Acidiferrobacterales bacterium]|nr:acyltransferase [Acidiferrobacterales bacterium]
MIKYRPEIDGLRAVAVLAVVVYHARFTFNDSILLSGGYLGVDIFFVISGFLITSIILKNLSNNEFSFLNFYERRARRILPALFFIITCSIPFAWWLLLPEPMQQYAGSVLSSLFFSSNIWFFLEDSYTAEPSLYKPFLHTWSLSVEEQFYVFFPVLLLLTWRFSKNVGLFIYLFLLVLSLMLADWASTQYIDANFYLLPFRMWELIGGALLALLATSNRTSNLDKISDAKNSMLMIVASVLLLLPILFFNEETRHPSTLTVAPVLGTMILIRFARENDLVTKLLSSSACVAIGKWSYSLYLWHFPIFAFARIHKNSLSDPEKIALILISILLSALSYRWIEQPFRSSKKIETAKFIKLIVVWFALICLIFAYIFSSNGVPQRLGPLQDIFSNVKVIPVFKDGANCHQRPSDSACVFSKENSAMIINVGDSHANAQAQSLKNLADKFEMGYIQLSEDACPLVKDAIGFRDSTRINNCHGPSQAKRIAKINQFENSIIVYNGRFPYYLSKETFDNQIGGKEIGPSSWMSPSLDGDHDVDFVISKVQETITDLLDQGHRVVIIYPVPEAAWDIPKLLSQNLSKFPVGARLREFRNLQITTPFDVYRERTSLSFKMFDEIANHPNLIRVYPDQLFCEQETDLCYTHNSENIYYQDDDHLSPYGAQLVTDQIEQALFNATNQ